MWTFLAGMAAGAVTMVVLVVAYIKLSGMGVQ